MAEWYTSILAYTALDEIFSPSDDAQIRAVFPLVDRSMMVFIANILIGNKEAKRLNDCVGRCFTLCGFHAKKVKFGSGKEGHITLLFGFGTEHTPCAFTTTSERVLDALQKIALVFGKSLSERGVPVRIADKEMDNGTSYTLEVLDTVE